MASRKKYIYTCVILYYISVCSRFRLYIYAIYALSVTSLPKTLAQFSTNQVMTLSLKNKRQQLIGLFKRRKHMIIHEEDNGSAKRSCVDDV